MDEFSEEQKQYLQGLASGVAIARLHGRAGRGAAAQDAPAGPERIHFEAQNRFLAEGKKLAAEEQAKRAKHPLDMWDELRARARKGEFPKGTDVFLTKFFGLFYAAPAQDSYMCRLRLPNGILTAHQLRGVADLAERFGGGYSHVTTRANLQIREVGARDALKVLTALYELGIVNRGSGADNIRNVTGDATAGISPQELIDTRALCRDMHYTILNHRELYGLPRKFNIAFDGGGPIAVLEDTNDIGFTAVRVGEGKTLPAGIHFRVALGGTTGHGDFARDLGIAIAPEQCVPVAVAIVRVFIEHGDRTDRTKARMKYIIDRHGLEWYLAEVEKVLGAPLPRLPLSECEPRPPLERFGHVGVHPQKQEGFRYVGIALPVGRLEAAQMKGLARIAGQYGSGDIRLTVWQNLILSDIPEAQVDAVKREIEALGLAWRAASVRAGMVACTGNTGCKFSASDTKRHAMAIADYVEPRVKLDAPVNIHLTGCHHSCAQHYIGDIGLLACKVGDEGVEGYHVYVGGGYGARKELARELVRDVPADAAPALIERLLAGYLEQRSGANENFQQFAQRLSVEALRALAQHSAALAA
ncbi:MAG: NirA family protein [Betaproteobacteria bacterium]|nr:NirA family protein [Betaproteobacteria bacterium]